MADPLGAQLKRARERRGWSLARTADRAGVSTAYVQKLERGEVGSPSPHKLRGLSAALEIPYAEVMGLAGYGSPEGASPGGEDPARVLAQALQAEDISADELEELSEYLHFRRRQRGAGD